MTRYLILFALVTGLSACDQKGSLESTKERAKAEEEANRDVENKNLAEKAQKMEADLALRHYYYSAIEGEYLGTVAVGSETFNMRRRRLRFGRNFLEVFQNNFSFFLFLKLHTSQVVTVQSL